MSGLGSVRLSLVLSIICCLACLTVPDDAFAFGLQFDGGLRLGGAVVTSDNDNVDIPAGFGTGGQFSVLAKIVPKFAVGANFDIAYSTHSDDPFTTEFILPSVGGVIRSDFLPFLGAKVWGNYVFATVKTSGEVLGQNVEAEGDASGGQVGFEVFYRYKFSKKSRFAIEAGPYFAISFLSRDSDDSSNSGGDTSGNGTTMTGGDTTGDIPMFAGSTASGQTIDTMSGTTTTTGSTSSGDDSLTHLHFGLKLQATYDLPL